MRPLKPYLTALGLISFLIAPAMQCIPATAEETITTIAKPLQTAASARPPNGRVMPEAALLRSIAAWLADNFDLPATTDVPKVVLVPQARLASLRYREPNSSESTVQAVAAGEMPGRIVALYDPLLRVIYLADGWRGETPAEVSVLVHEMVHYLQDVAKLRFECPQAQEQLAYAAQERWLASTGHSLAEDFEVDPFTLLVLTRCFQ